MRRIRKKLMALLLAVVMVCSLLVSDVGVAFAADHTITNATFVVKVTAPGAQKPEKEVDLSTYVFKNGENISIGIDWNIANNDSSINPGDTLVYDLPNNAGINLTSSIGDVVDNKIAIGTYSIVGNQVKITITDEELFKRNNIEGGMDINATINVSDTVFDEKGNVTTTIMDKNATVNVADPTSKPTVNKTKGTVYSEGGKNYQTFTVEVTENGTGTSLDIVDTLGAHYTYKEGSFKVDNLSQTPIINGQEISYKLNPVTKGTKYTITYDVEIADEAYNQEFSWYLGDSDYHNAVTATNNNGLSSSISTFGLTYKDWVNKSGNFDSNTGLINWKVVVNDGDSIDISGATIKDVIPTGLEMVGDATITPATSGGSSITESQLTSGYTFPAGSVGKYTITYQTKVTASTKGMSSTTYTNEAIFQDETYKANSTATYPVTVGYNWINKSVASVDKNAQEINWQTVITVPSTQTMSVPLKFSDVFGTGLKYKTDSFKVDYTGLTVTGANSGNVTSTSTGLEADLGQVTYKAGGDNKIIITYTTTYDPDGAEKVTFTNTAKVSDGVTSQTDDASYTYEQAAVKAIEYKRYEKIDGTKVTWALQVKVPDSINNNLDDNDHIYLYDTPTLVDSDGKTVNAEFSLVDGSISVQDGVAPNGLIKAEKLPLPDGRIRFDITEYQKTYKDNYYNLYYTLALDSDTVKDIADDKSGKSYSMYNTVSASLFDGDKEEQKLGTINQNQAAVISVGDILTKTYKYDDTTKFNAEYTVLINPDGLDLVGSSGSIHLEDVLGKNLSIDLRTIKLTDGSGNLITGYTPSYDSATRKLTIYNIPDETPCTLTYTVLVNVDYKEDAPTFESQAGSIDVSNVCTLYVEDTELVKNEVKLSGSIYHSSAWASSDYNTITIIKHNKAFEGLAGANFQIKAYKEDNGEMVEYTNFETDWSSKGYTIGAITTSDGGKKIINLRSDILYEITETQAPAGYAPLSKPIYVIVPGNDYAGMSDALNKFKNDKGIKVNEVKNSEFFYIENQEAGYSAYIEKVDQDGNPVSGAEFTLYKFDGTNYVQVSEAGITNPATTDANGKISFTGLTAGDYRLTETAIPTGYDKSVSITENFTLNESNKTYTLQANNNKIYGTWTINKTDADDGTKKLQGVVFGLYDESGDLIESKTTDANGQVVFEKLKLDVAYTVKEITPLDGYLVNNTVYSIKNTPGNNTFTVDYASEITNVENTKEKGSIQITKSEADAAGDPTATVLSGAVYTLYDSNKKPITDENGTIVTATTDGSGIAKFENLKWDTYYVRETVAPSGYAIDTAYYQAVLTSDNVYTMERTNVKLSTVAPFVSFKFRKLGYNPDGTSSVVLPGAVYGLYNTNDPTTPVAKAISDSNGYVYFMNITYAPDNSSNADTFYDFYIEEESAPTGYVLSAERYSIDIDTEFVSKYGNNTEYTNDDKESIVELETSDTFKGFVNYEYEGRIQVVKTAENGTTPLAGAKFEIYKNGSTSASGVVTTGADGKGTFTGLEYGATYIVKEVEPPAGYKLSTQSFTVTIGAIIDVSNPSVTSVYNGISDNILLYNAGFINAPLELSISKRAITGLDEIYGATLTLKKLNGTVIDTWTSGGAPHSISYDKLKVHEVYTLTETAAPNGYGYSESITFTIKEDGSIDITSGGTEANNLDGNTVIMKDKAIGVTLSKIDAITGNKLNGATLQITDTSGKILHQWTYSDLKISSTNAATFGIKPATVKGTYNEYIFKEADAPTGYYKAEDIHFFVDYYGNVFLKSGSNYVNVSTMSDTITMSDVPETGAVVFSKVALGGGTELPGASITITDSITKLEKARWTSTNIAHTMNTSEFVKDRDYILEETNAPTGYAYAESITFRIASSDGKVYIKDASGNYAVASEGKIVMEDKAIDISVSKLTNDSVQLKGATLNLFDGNSDLIHSFTSDVTPEEIGKYLKAGSGNTLNYYRLVEASAPFGYEVADPILFGVDKDGAIHLYNGSAYVKTTSTTIKMIDNRRYVSISKCDITNVSKELPGAKLSITANDGTSIEWTSTNAVHKVPMSQLKPNIEYTLTEITAPKGYAVAESIVFMLDNSGNVSVKTDAGFTPVSNGTVVMKDVPIDVSISKLDENGKALSGASLRILDGSGNVVHSFTTNGTLEDIGSMLSVGTSGNLSPYTLEEVAAPYGYKIAEVVKFGLDEKGVVHIYNAVTGLYEASNSQVITMTDEKAYVNISKVDMVNKKELPGAKLTISSADGILDEWTSTDTMHSILVSYFKPDVEYTLTEVTAPKGYEVAESIVFKLNTSGTVLIKTDIGFIPVTSNTVVMEDELSDGITGGDSEVITTETSKEPPKDTSDATVKTGDTAPIDKMFVMMVMSGLGLVLFGSRRRKYYKKEVR